MKTAQQKAPFDTLLYASTKAHFFSDDAFRPENPIIYRKLPDAGPDAVSVLFEADWGTFEDAELIVRLLNFAHAGGGTFLADLMRYDGARLTATGMEDLERLLAVLNGKPQPEAAQPEKGTQP
jgi:hypothetical protein